MTASRTIHRIQRDQWLKALLLLSAGLLITVTASLLASQQPLLAVAVAVALPLGIAIFVWPDAATLTVVFLVYTNAIIVAVKFHGLPRSVGGVLPGILLALPLVKTLLFQRKKILYDTAMLFLIIAYIVIQLLGAWFSIHPDESLQAVFELLVEGIAIYFLLINAIRTPTMLRQVVWALLLAGLVLGAVPLYQQLTGTFDNNYAGFGQLSTTGFTTGESSIFGEVRQFRLAGSIGEKNRFAQILLMLIPLGLLRFWGERSKWLRLGALAATSVISLGFVLAFSRGGAVSFAVVIVVMLFLKMIRPRQLLVIVVGVLLILAAMPQYRARIATIQSFTAMFSGEPSGTGAEPDGAIQGRTTEMLAAALVFADHPIVGVGPDMFRYYSQEYGNQLGMHIIEAQREAHSLFLNVAADNGLLGLIVFLAIVWITTRNLWRTYRRWKDDDPELANIAASFFAAMIAYLSTGLFLHLSYVRYFWLLLALSGAVSSVAKLAEAESRSAEKRVVTLSANALGEER